MSTLDLDTTVTELAEAILSDKPRDEFEKLANERSRGLGIADLPGLRRMFHSPPNTSDLYSANKHGLGGWLSACQFAIFELVYNIGEDALPFVREVAWGVYDWTQGNAIELLIRFAAAGVRRDEILAELASKYPKVRFEAQLYAISPLVPKLEDDPQLRCTFDELLKISEFKEAFEEITEQ